MKTIQALPIDNKGTLLFLKDFREENGRFYIKYRAMINNIPFKEDELFLVDGGKNFVITGDNAKVLYRFPIQYALNTKEDE